MQVFISGIVLLASVMAFTEAANVPKKERFLRLSSSSSPFHDPKSVSPKCHVKTDVEKKSQYKEDEIVFEKFYANPPKCKGTVLEIGGFDGKKLSNSWFFEYALDWQAILIEAFPDNYEKMVKNRPHAIHVFGAMCRNDGGTNSSSSSSSSASTTPGVVEFAVGRHPATGGIMSDMSSYHKERFTTDETGIVMVPCQTIAHVLLDHTITHIDVFFLDVEGAELSVLQTIDWEAVTIDIFVVEMNDTDPMKDEAVRLLLHGRGYSQPFNLRDECRQRRGGVQCVNNEIYVLPEIMARLS